MLGFLVAGGLGGTEEFLAERGALLTPSAVASLSDCSVLSFSLLNMFCADLKLDCDLIRGLFTMSLLAPVMSSF